MTPGFQWPISSIAAPPLARSARGAGVTLLRGGVEEAVLER